MLTFVIMVVVLIGGIVFLITHRDIKPNRGFESVKPGSALAYNLVRGPKFPGETGTTFLAQYRTKKQADIERGLAASAEPNPNVYFHVEAVYLPVNLV